ncbi:MAG: DUF2807 domain-containing protein [Paludibacter sp.]|nr:DUF2807 domain-containing protein [Paludibacter sp.]
MKKTLTINLNNIVFHIDDDAYELLQTYLADVSRHLSEDERKEVMADVEARIAELFTERLQKNKNVVNIDDVEQIINVLGKPNEYGEGEDEQAEKESTKSERKKARRFYRDPENAVLGGVAAGVAAYFSWDVTWVRIVFVILALISGGNMIPVYLLVWIIAPKAVSASQRLEMQGEDVTIESIKSEINNVKNYMGSDKFKQSATSMGNKFLDAMRAVFKVIFGLLGAVFGFVGMIVAGALVLALLFFIFEPGIFNGFSPEIVTDWAVLTPDKTIMLVLSVLLVIGCPVFMLIFWGIRIVSGRRDRSPTISWVVFILWIAGLFMLYSVGTKTIIHWNKSNAHPWVIDWDNNDDFPVIDESRTVDKFTALEVSGNINLEYVQDSVKSVTISAPEKLLPYVKTVVTNGKLNIYCEKVFINRKINVKITNDSLIEIDASGASKIESNSLLKVPEFKLDLSGASQVRMDVEVSGLFDADLSGASYADIDGRATSVKIEADGASKIEADQLQGEYVKAEASGASHVRVYATENFDGHASGAGHIECKGNPKKFNKSESGGSNITIR